MTNEPDKATWILQRIDIIQLAELMRFSSSLAQDCKKSSKFGRLRLKEKFRFRKEAGSRVATKSDVAQFKLSGNELFSFFVFTVWPSSL
jgi:hypothetical protein